MKLTRFNWVTVPAKGGNEAIDLVLGKAGRRSFLKKFIGQQF